MFSENIKDYPESEYRQDSNDDIFLKGVTNRRDDCYTGKTD